MTLDLPHDKALHIIGGVVIYAVAAVGKEIYDYFNREKHTPEVMDAIATLVGGVLGFICTL